jgi:hypothetical protein
MVIVEGSGVVEDSTLDLSMVKYADPEPEHIEYRISRDDEICGGNEYQFLEVVVVSNEGVEVRLEG